ncbi:MAG: DUF4091 domain-containing protein [Eubacterium sp.]|nr:DUF4091 domain-containing protein [Eubacterium sp.]
MEIKILSSLAKIFPDEICNEYEIDTLSCLKNERVSFQLAVKSDSDMSINVHSDCEQLKIYKIQYVPAGLTAEKDRDDYFIRNAKSGDYPDILIPIDSEIQLIGNEWTPVWCEFVPDGKLNVGEHEITVSVGDEVVKVKAKIIDASFSDQSLICTHWFHTDCLATYYNVEVFSDEYWRIVENFMRTAVSHGINMILTPLFTPPLDTQFGGERPTVQLVDVKKEGDRYTFVFDKLKKWIDLADKCGIKYFEMSHLYTQWGARHAPKIMAQTSRGYKRIFGWGTNSHGKRYSDFLRQLAPKLIRFIDENGLRNRCMFHISDEPQKRHYRSYKKSAEIMKDLFADFKKIDALSEFSFYEHGLTEYPITNIMHIEDFVGKVPELWTYYCCNPCNKNLPNRFIAMPSLRNRILGFIMYAYDVKGFLHWGYNFYYTRYSKRKVDPFTETDAGGEFPSGDSYVVYPSPDGSTYVSLRLKVFYDAIQDFEALKLLEKKIGREKTLEILNKDLEKPITARDYPHSEKWLIEKRNEINRTLAM